MGSAGSSNGDPMNTQRAVVREGGGMVFKNEYPSPPSPLPGSNSVTVQVRAAGINPVDYKVGKMMLGPVVGLDFSGVVTYIPAGENRVAVGDEVYGNVAGTLQDSVVCEIGKISKKPKCLSFVEAAAMPTAYLTGLQGLRDHGNGVTKGKTRVLVLGASGGCGSAAVQLAAAMGSSHIVGVCSAKNSGLVKGCGAHQVVNYKTENFASIFAGSEKDKFDIVYDAASSSGGGEAYSADAYRVLKKGGKYVPLNGSASFWIRKFTGMQAKNTSLVLTSHSRGDLDEISRLALLAGGRVRPVLDSVLPFSKKNVEKGFARLKSRRAQGKIVFDFQTTGPPKPSQVPVAPVTATPASKLS